MIKQRSVINYFFIFISINWGPLQNSILTFDAKARTLFVLSIIVFVVNYFNSDKFRTIVRSKPAVFWGVWILYSIVNLVFKGYHGELPLVFFCVLHLFLPFVVMLVSCSEWIEDSKIMTKALTLIFLIYGIFTVTMIKDFAGLHSADHTQFIGGMGNAGALNTMFLIFFSGILLVNKWAKPHIVILLIIFAVFVILAVATRKAFGAALIMIFFIILSQIRMSPKKILLVGALVIGLVLSHSYVMDHTVLGRRLNDIEETSKLYNKTNIAVFDLLGDRTYYYLKGWELFVKHPVTGIGLRNFRIKTGSNETMHSEYMVQLAEGGIIGSFLFILFSFWFLINLYKHWREYPVDRKNIWILTGGLFSILFVNVTAWTYAFPQYFVCYGIIIGFLFEEKYEDSYS